jgi:hypothetical protein
MKKIIYLLLVLPVLIFAQSQDQNYIKTTTYKVATTQVPTPTDAQKVQNVNYFDGLGRPIQQVAVGQSGSGKDIVTHIAYDAFGRQTKEYLPYVPSTTASNLFKTTAATDVMGYYNNAQYGYANNPFSEKQFESSPLNRIMQQAAPGTDWGLAVPSGSTTNHTIKMDYQTNTATEVKNYDATATWNAPAGKYLVTPSQSTVNAGFYAAGQLYKTITKDENWGASPLTPKAGTTEEFKDKEVSIPRTRTPR